VVWGSTLILHWLERFPSLLYVGGAVLAWTAVKMITAEPFLEEFFEERRGLVNALYVLVVGGTLGSAWLRNRRAITQKSLQKA
jgi:predicted tellurium resistance membrane protein TerC